MTPDLDQAYAAAQKPTEAAPLSGARSYVRGRGQRRVDLSLKRAAGKHASQPAVNRGVRTSAGQGVSYAHNAQRLCGPSLRSTFVTLG
jgi:hypothetical protein